MKKNIVVVAFLLLSLDIVIEAEDQNQKSDSIQNIEAIKDTLQKEETVVVEKIDAVQKEEAVSSQVAVVQQSSTSSKGFFTPIKEWFEAMKQWFWKKLKNTPAVKPEEIKPILEGEEIVTYVATMSKDLQIQYEIIAKKCRELEDLLCLKEWTKEQEELALTLSSDKELAEFLKKATQDHKNYQNSLILVLKYQILKRLDTRRAERILSDVQQLFEVDVDEAVKELVRRSRVAVTQKENFKRQVDEMAAIVETYLDAMKNYEQEKQNISDAQQQLMDQFARLYSELKKVQESTKEQNKNNEIKPEPVAAAAA